MLYGKKNYKNEERQQQKGNWLEKKFTGGFKDMEAVIKVNGVERPESLCIVDTLNNVVKLTEFTTPERKLDLDYAYAEVNIFGDIDYV